MTVAYNFPIFFPGIDKGCPPCENNPVGLLQIFMPLCDALIDFQQTIFRFVR